MSLEALLALLTVGGFAALIFGFDRVVRRDRSALDKRLRRYGGRAYQLNDEEQKQAANDIAQHILALVDHAGA